MKLADLLKVMAVVESYGEARARGEHGTDLALSVLAQIIAVTQKPAAPAAPATPAPSEGKPQ